MAPTGNKKNLFPRGGTVVSKSQKDKKMMKKVRKQVGKKPDLFAEKKKIRSMPKVKSKKNVDLPQAAEDAEIMSGDEIEDVPRSALCLTVKMVERNCKALCFVRSVDEMGLAVIYPGGATGFIKIDQISDQVDSQLKEGKNFELSKLYTPGDSLLTSVSTKRKKNKFHLSARPEHVNQHLLVDQLKPGQILQGSFISKEDTGWTIDIGKEASRGFISLENLENGLIDNIAIGKSTYFRLSQILLDGRQIILDIPSAEPLKKFANFDHLLPGTMAPFKIKKKNKTGLIGSVYGFQATMHVTQNQNPLENQETEDSEITAKIIYVDYEKKRVILANSDGYMTGKCEAPKDRDGEKVTGEIVYQSSQGLLLKLRNEEILGWVPRHNITEQKLQDTISHYEVGKEVNGRIIDYLIGEGLHHVTLRESVVEAEFFRYDSFFASQMVQAKVITGTDSGWVNVSLGPHLYGTLAPYHLSNSMLSKETLKSKFKEGQSLRLMVLNKSDRVYLTAKQQLIKSKLKRFTNISEIEVNDISLGTVIMVAQKHIIVQFFNNIKERFMIMSDLKTVFIKNTAFIPIAQLSLEFIKSASDNYEVGQTVRVRVMEIQHDKPGSQIVGSLILDPTLKLKKEQKGDDKGIFGNTVESFEIQGDEGGNAILGRTNQGAEGIIYDSDLSVDLALSKTFFNQIKKRKEPVENAFVETKMKGDRLKISNVNLLKEAISHGDEMRLRNFEQLEPGKVLLGRVVRENEFGFFIHFGGKTRGFLHRAQCVDRFVPDHKGLLEVGQLVTAKVTEVDSEKQRFLVTLKESEIENDTDIPAWIQIENIFESYQRELNSFCDYSGIPFHFGDTVLLKFTIKCEYERSAQKSLPVVEFPDCPDGISGVFLGKSTGEMVSAKFLGVHSENQLLFASKDLEQIGDTRVLYSNSFMTCLNKEGKLALVSSRNGLLAQRLSQKKDSKVEAFISKDLCSISVGLIKKASKKGARENWGVSSVKDLRVDGEHDGIIHSVQAKGIKISIGRDVTVNCFFGGISPYFIPREKTVEICKKYFPRGKKVRVSVLEVHAKYAVVKMAEDYIDGEKEGLTISKKRKLELEKAKTEAKLEKMIKLELPAKKKEVKDEPAPQSLAEISAMDFEFDTVEGELNKRAKMSEKEVITVEKSSEKILSVEEVEEKAREAERDLESAKLPEDVSGWERAVLATPNNSEVWLRYSAFHIVSGEIEKARLTMNRALKKINFREQEDRLNVWKARLNLETLYGDDESLAEQFQEAKRCNDELKIYACLVDIQIESQKFASAANTLRDAVKKFPDHLDFWMKLCESQLQVGESQKAKVTLERALQANKAKQHVFIIQKFARIEFNHGDPERAKTLLEQTLKVHPKRADIWGAYSDMLLKFSSIEEARKALERGIELCSKSRGRVHLIKRIISLESRNGDEQAAQEWRTKLESENNRKSIQESMES